MDEIGVRVSARSHGLKFPQKSSEEVDGDLNYRPFLRKFPCCRTFLANVCVLLYLDCFPFATMPSCRAELQPSNASRTLAPSISCSAFWDWGRLTRSSPRLCHRLTYQAVPFHVRDWLSLRAIWPTSLIFQDGEKQINLVRLILQLSCITVGQLDW